MQQDFGNISDSYYCICLFQFLFLHHIRLSFGWYFLKLSSLIFHQTALDSKEKKAQFVSSVHIFYPLIFSRSMVNACERSSRSALPLVDHKCPQFLNLTTAVSDDKASALFQVNGEQVGFLRFLMILTDTPALLGHVQGLKPKQDRTRFFFFIFILLE